jgi:hypothetical protein
LAAERVLKSGPGRPLVQAVQEFVTKLEALPDAGPSEHTREELVLTRDLAECVVTEIENRIGGGNGAPRMEQELAGAVYAIRRALEGIHRWERHFLDAER